MNREQAEIGGNLEEEGVTITLMPKHGECREAGVTNTKAESIPGDSVSPSKLMANVILFACTRRVNKA